MLGLFLETTACCNQRRGKAENFNSYFASIFSIKGNEPTIGKGNTKVVYWRKGGAEPSQARRLEKQPWLS